MSSTLYFLKDYPVEQAGYVPTLEGNHEWLGSPAPEFGRDDPAKNGEQFALTTLTLADWCKATWEDGEWCLNRPFEVTGFLAVVSAFGAADWAPADILSGEIPGEMVEAWLEANGASAEEASPLWIVCGDRNAEALLLTYNGPAAAPSISVAATS